MQYLDTSPPEGELAQTWQLFFKNSLLRRLDAKRVSSAMETLMGRGRVRPEYIARILLGFRVMKCGAEDPLLFQYAELLVRAKHITTADLLLALLKRSHFEDDKIRSDFRCGMPSCEEQIFALLTNIHLTTDLPRSPIELQSLIYAITRWLKTVEEYEMGKQLEGGGLHTLDYYTCGMYEALGSLAISVLGNQGIRVLSKQRWWKGKRATVVTEMESYDTQIMQWINSQYAGRLRALSGLPPYIELDAKGRPIFSDQQILDSISDVPLVHSRAGLFVWLNAALTARPLTDDMPILSFLHARYAGDVQSSIVDLLVACFDVFTNAVLRKESAQSLRIIRSFIANKVPLLISMLSGSMVPPTTTDECIQMALIPGGMISMDALPPITPGANEVRDSLKKVRLEFLQACALHSLVTETTVNSLLQETTSLPRVAKYNKDSLVSQCASNISRLEGLVSELEAMQGNAGAIANCIVETIGNLCMNKDSMSLKSACNELLKKVPSMDIIMLFTQPGMILMPLCTLLNEWVHDQEQTEFTPSYEEFASILLFSLVMIHRYDLDISEIGVLPDSFISGLLGDISTSRPLSELTPDQNSQLHKWIEGLFAVDEHGETSGISDDVMRQCSPQAFYQLVPTLFEQSVLASRSNALPMKTFKGGLELLLEPFLLPSLVMGLRWIAEHSWEDHNDAEILLQVLDKLLKPSSNSQETKAMHSALLSMVAVPLNDSLQNLLRKQPEKKKAIELSNLLSRYLGNHRCLRGSKTELDEWIKTDGSLEGRVQRSIQELVAWAVTSSSPPDPPPRYTYREFAIACQVMEPSTILESIVQELMQSPNVSLALDVCTAMICAPSSVPMGAQQSTQSIGPTSKLRNSVRLIGSNVRGLLSKKQVEAEALVRLGRRVEAQLAVVQLPPMAVPLQIQEQTTDQIMQDLGMELPANGTGVGVGNSMEQTAGISGLDQQLDLSNPSDQEIANLAASATAMDIDQSNMFGGMNLDMIQNSQNNQQMDLQSQEDDIFAGLDMGMGDLGDDFFA